MTSNPPKAQPIVRALTGAQIAAGAMTGFPASIPPKQVLTEQDIAVFAEASLDPHGEFLPRFPAKSWLPANERIANCLGRAQHALRDLDDQRAIVRSVDVVGGSVVVRLLRAPNLETVRNVHQARRRHETVNCCFFGAGELQVILEWPLI